jgi:hypothetical protein
MEQPCMDRALLPNTNNLPDTLIFSENLLRARVSDRLSRSLLLDTNALKASIRYITPQVPTSRAMYTIRTDSRDQINEKLTTKNTLTRQKLLADLGG